jgi:hypothetical protein
MRDILDQFERMATHSLPGPDVSLDGSELP